MTKHAQLAASERMRSGTLNMRIDPKVKYLAEKLAKYQQRTLSNFIEGAVRRALTDVIHDEPNVGTTIPPKMPPAPMWGDGLWSDDEATRFFMLATAHPDLLNVSEMRLWTLLSGSMMKNYGKITLKRFVEYYNSPSIYKKHLSDVSNGGDE